MKYGPVLGVAFCIVAVFSWASFGEITIGTRVERLFYFTPLMLCVVFWVLWYRIQELSDKLEKLERKESDRADS